VPKPAGIELLAMVQNRVSAEGEVKLRLSIAIGSNSSSKINPVPTHAAGTKSPIRPAITSCPGRLPERSA